MMSARAGEKVSALSTNIGSGFVLGEGSLIGGIGGPAESVEIGDNVTIGAGVEIRARNVRIGDYVTIHRNSTAYGYESLEIGECCWIGQNVILNCTADLKIGRACVISAYSNIWTHFSGGDVLQGCRFDSAQNCTLEDDVWIGVQASIAPVHISSRALVLAGSIVTRDIPANQTWGGNPAADLTEKLGAPYRDVSTEEKFERMCERLEEFWSGPVRFSGAEPLLRSGGPGWLRLGDLTITMTDTPPEGASQFDVRSRTYSKTGSPQEVAFMRSLLYRIKFFAS